MLKGHVFSQQTFGVGCFALFMDEFLAKHKGIIKGCELSNTANSATIGAGFFVICGRFLEVIGSETVSSLNNDGYYSLVCEIDLSQSNTNEQLNQASIKVLTNASAYPTLTQQDLNDSGTLYQYEFAKFRIQSGSMTDFTDRRTFLNFTSIYDEIETIIENLEQESDLLFKTGGTMSGKLYANGGIEGNVKGNIEGNVTGNCSGSSGSCTRK